MLDQFTIVADGLDHPEGVAVGPDGRLYAGGEAGQLYAVGTDGKVRQLASTGGFALGLALDGDGRAYICDMARAEVLRADLASGQVATYSGGAPGAPFRAPNHPAFDAAGNLYVTDSGVFDADDGVVYRVAPGGNTQVWTDRARRFPNGSALSPRRDALYVVESTRPGVTRVPINADGTAGDPEVVAELPGTVPDGIAFDEAGNAYVGCYRPDRIYRIAPDGRVEVFADDPRGTTLAAPTNVVFTGPRRRTLGAASLGRWHLAAVEVEVSGTPLEYPSIG